MENKMILRLLTPDHTDIPKVKKLFEEAFPENERTMSMDDILAHADELPIDLIGIYPDETPDDFAGFFLTFKSDASVYLVYFATCPEKRSGGIGSKAIGALKEFYGEKPILFSYESVYEESDNAEQRERRRSFYLKNGFFETGWFARMNDTEFILASSKEGTGKEDFEAFLAGMTAGVPGAAAPELYRHD